MNQRLHPGTRTDYVDFYPLQTRWKDSDIYGHLNNVVSYSLFDTAVNGWLIKKGLLNPNTDNTYGVVAETGCRYYSEMGFPDTIDAGLRITYIGTSSVRYEIGLFRNDQNLASSEGFFVHVYVARSNHKPVPIKNYQRKAFESLIPNKPSS